MPRPLSGAMQTAIGQSVVRPVIIGRLDFESDPIYAWSGPGLFLPTTSSDPKLNGQVYDPLDSFVEISNIMEDQGVGGPVTIVAGGASLDMPVMRQIVRDKRKWLGREAFLWLGFLNEDEGTVVADPTRIKTGVMTSVATKRSGNESVVEITIDRDLGFVKSAPLYQVNHSRFYDDDTFSHYVVKLANKPKGLERSDLMTKQNTPNFTPWTAGQYWSGFGWY